jgi:hypothetical protein
MQGKEARLKWHRMGKPVGPSTSMGFSLCTFKSINFSQMFVSNSNSQIHRDPTCIIRNRGHPSAQYLLKVHIGLVFAYLAAMVMVESKTWTRPRPFD